MKLSQQIFGLVVFLAIVVKEGFGQDATSTDGTLKCYDCTNYKPEDKCDDVGPETKVTTCAANQTMCRKIEQHIHFNGKDHIRTIRQCATSGDTGSCLERTGTYKFKSWYCQCKDSLCNGAGNLALSTSLIGVALLSVVYCLRKLL